MRTKGIEKMNSIDRLEEPETWDGVSEEGDTFCVDYSWFSVRFSFSRFVEGDSVVTVNEWSNGWITLADIDTEEDRYSWLGKSIREALKDHFEVYISCLEEELSEKSLELAKYIAKKDKLNLPIL